MSFGFAFEFDSEAVRWLALNFPIRIYETAKY